MSKNNFTNNPGDWAEYDRIFGEAKEEPLEDKGGDFEDVPPGKYNVKIERAEWKESKSGLRFLSFGLVILTGSLKGRWIFKSGFIHNVQSAKFLIKDLAIIGIKIDRISSLNLESLLDIELEVKVWVQPSKKEPGKEFRNVDFIRQIDAETVSQQETEAEDTPF